MDRIKVYQKFYLLPEFTRNETLFTRIFHNLMRRLVGFCMYVTLLSMYCACLKTNFDESKATFCMPRVFQVSTELNRLSTS